MKQIHDLYIPKIIPDLKEKRKKKIIYINADEDHVSLQFHHKKGDLKENENGYKNNTVMPKLIYVFEGIKKEGPKSKRNQLINKHCFGGVYSDNEKLWEEVMAYIDEVYDEETIETIYLMGDGASWIKKGVDVLGAKCRFVLDKFHLKQYVTRATSHLEEKAAYVRSCIEDEINLEDQDGLKRIFKLIIEETQSESKKEQVRKTRDYILNHWEAIIIRNDDPDARMGCSAEGNISHIYSSRLSSRPLGWSKTGVDQMARLRIYRQNGGKVYDLMKCQKQKQEREIEQAIQIEMDRNIR
ncbi:MAG: ISLre2 family transposase, partial [Dethiosulfatibacter sp.]|nr:ISLre2 family transposase [Dethiosulfatibacter sp.]